MPTHLPSREKNGGTRFAFGVHLLGEKMPYVRAYGSDELKSLPDNGLNRSLVEVSGNDLDFSAASS